MLSFIIKTTQFLVYHLLILVNKGAGNTLIHCDPPPHVIYADHLSRHGLLPGEPWRRIASLAELLDIVL